MAAGTATAAIRATPTSRQRNFFKAGLLLSMDGPSLIRREGPMTDNALLGGDGLVDRPAVARRVGALHGQGELHLALDQALAQRAQLLLGELERHLDGLVGRDLLRGPL